MALAVRREDTMEGTVRSSLAIFHPVGDPLPERGFLVRQLQPASLNGERGGFRG